ncbi:MAG: hypothetical protein LBD67_03535 [Candidatus Accumulibacter sp.]|nr:hypothetical protein [Accumulibacter sp.]
MKKPLHLVFCAAFAMLAAHPALAQEGISQQEAEQFAAVVFSSDIKAGKLTRQKAGTFFKCGNDRYAKKLSADPQMAMTLADATMALNTATKKLSAAEKEKYGRAYKEAERLQREAEDGCRKELGIDPSVKRLFDGFGAAASH